MIDKKISYIKIAFLLFIFIPSILLASQKGYYIQTFDSGFGGFFTAKAIEEEAKNPDMTFVACNTASTRKDQANHIIDAMYGSSKSRSISYIIEASNKYVQKLLKPTLLSHDRVNISIISTPATLKSGAYPKALAKLYGGEFDLGQINKVIQDRWYKQNNNSKITSLTRVSIIRFNNKEIFVYQLAPANWVDLVEHGANKKTKERIISRDIKLLKNLIPKGIKIDVFGEFCTHYPVVDELIKSNTISIKNKKSNYILQGPLMAKIFLKNITPELKKYKRKKAVSKKELQRLYKELKPSIVLTGNNTEETRKLVNTIFDDNNETIIRSNME